jgi:hypothetical protein
MENNLKSKMELAKELVKLIFSAEPTPIEAKKTDVVAAPVTEPAENSPMGGPIGPQLKDATLQSGKKVQYNEPPTVGDAIFEIAADGTQAPLADGTIEINETPITVKDGKIESIAAPGDTDEEDKPTKEGQPGQDEGSVTAQQFSKEEIDLKFKKLEADFNTKLEDIKLAYENKLKAALSVSATDGIKKAPETVEEKKPLTRMDLIEKRVQLKKQAKHGQLFKSNEMK